MGDELRESESKPVTLEYAPAHPNNRKGLWWRGAIGVCCVVAIGAILLPALTRSVPRATRVQCGTNERQLLAAITIYANQNQGTLPPTLRAAFAQSLAGKQSQLFQCPAGPGAYVYLGAGLNLKSLPPDTILIYEPPSNHKSTQTGKLAMNIGQADGAVHLIESPKAEKIIAELKAGHNPPRAEKLR